MQIGEVPTRTCLSYINGMYRECLLSGFDSNKKIVLAKKSGKLVDRAIIRLTKGCFRCLSGALEFADLLESKNKAHKKNLLEKEWLTLFLECAYFNGLDDDDTKQMKKIFVTLIEEKAVNLNAMPVLSADYVDCFEENRYVSTFYNLYISRSKAGAQYLDSLGGAASVNDEGGYKRSKLFVPEKTIALLPKA